jgi:Leucine-rich repeat (LRR) protein
MKKNYLFYVALFLGITFTNAQKTTIPDETFRQFLIAAGSLSVDIESTDFDEQNQIDNSILAQITALIIPPPIVLGNQFIKDLTGIEAFTNLTTFSTSVNLGTEPHSFTEIDFSKNTELTSIHATYNHLVRLDLSNNTKLTSLDVSNNHLVNLNIANTNTNYWDNNSQYISVKGNYLSCVQVDANITENQAEGWNAFDSGITFRTTACDRYTYIPDTNFETALQNLKDDAGNSLNIDSGAPDKKVLTASISSITILDDANYQEVPESEKISDLTGIEDFSALTQLFIDGHSIKNIDLSNNKELLILSIQYNLLESISLENNIKITELILGDNQIDNLTVDGLAELKRLNIGDNKLTVFDISKNIKIEEFFIQNNLLSTLNIRNGNNNKILDLDTQNNPNLTCITVDDNFTDKDNLPNSVNWTLDAQTQLSTTGTCTTVQYTTITDAYFMQALIDGDHNITANDFDNDNKIETSKIENIEILKTTTDSKTYDIVTLQGLEDFKNLKELYTGSSVLETINVTNNLLLEKLVFGGPKITSIDISQNTALDSLSMGLTKINTLNLESNTNLETLEVFDTPLQELNLENNTELKNFKLANFLDTDKTNNVKVTTLDLTKNIALETVNIAGIETLTAINIQNGENEKITQIGLNVLPNLKCIQIDNNFIPTDNWKKDRTAYYSYDCNIDYTIILDANFRQALIITNGIKAEDFAFTNQIETSKIASITELYINDSQISDLTGIEGFTTLTELYASDNQLTNLDVSKNTALTDLSASDNQLTNLDVSKNTALANLFVYNNQLTSLDVSKNTALIWL